MLERLKKDLSYQESFDVTFRKVDGLKKSFIIVFLNFLCNHEAIVEIIYSLEHLNLSKQKDIAKEIYNENATITTDYQTIYNSILNGNIAIISDEEEVIICEVKNYPNRSIGEPENEKVVRGSRDGFTENIATNIALIRRRVKSGNLKVEKYEIGSISKTYVSLIYLDNFVDKKYSKRVKQSLDNINVEELTMTDKALEELMLKNQYTPYPLVKYTERPDTFCAHLYQGMFGILVDTSPSAMLGPISIFDHMQHAEEFRQSILAGSYLRFIRFIGIILSFISVPLWYTLLQFSLPFTNMFGNLFNVEFNKSAIFLQIILMELGVEFIRMASIHTPSALSTSMGLIAGIVIGEIAITIGVLSEQVVLLGAISAIGSYITPSYELSLANKISKIFIITSIFFFNIYGLVVSFIILIIYLCTLKSFGRSYLYPLIPFNGKDFLKQLFRFPYKKITKNKNKT